MVIFEILIYILFALILSNLAKKSDCLYPDSQKYDSYLICFISFFTIIAAIRWNVGSDSISYAVLFNKGIDSFDWHKEPLWAICVNLLHDIGFHWTIGLGLAAFLQIFFITKTLKEYKFILIMLPFVMFGGRYWMDLMGAVRQMIVACAFVWFSKYIYEKKLFKYLCFVLIASLVHKSALILLPFYFIPNKFQVEQHRIFLICILLCCVVIGQTPSFQGLISIITSTTDLIGYDNYSTVATELLNQGNTSEALSFGPMMLTYLLIPIFIIWFGPTLKEKYSKRIPYFSLWYNLSYLYACLYFLVCNVSHLFIRITLYFSLFQMIMASLLLFELYLNRSRNIKSQLLMIVFSLVIFTNSAWDITKAYGKTWESTTYKVYFLNTQQRKYFNL